MNMADRLTILQGDALTVVKTLPDESVQCCVTSPPYWGLRDYGVAGQLGLEKTPEEYVAKMVEVFREVRRVLRGDGTLFCNLGDSYASGDRATYRSGASDNKGQLIQNDMPRPKTPPGLKPKDLVGVPWMLAFALRADGWWLRQDIIWHKPNPMPESVTDRCTKAHEYIFLLTKSARYFYDAEAIKEAWTCDRDDMRENGIRTGLAYLQQGPVANNSVPASYRGSTFTKGKTAATKPNVGQGDRHESLAGRNKRSVWTVATSPYSEAHFATFPPDLIKPCILAGTSARGRCPKCGAPWERVVERGDLMTMPGRQGSTHGAKGNSNQDNKWNDDNFKPGRAYEYHTTGWQPTCSCDLTDPVPCTVLDCFFGSGCTGMVALELGRKCIGIELNPDYIKLAEQRCHVTPGLALA